MDIGALLERLRPLWVSRISSRLAQAEGLRLGLVEQITRFYNRLTGLVAYGETQEGIDALLAEWVSSRTETELKDPESNIAPVINQLLLALFEVCREELTDEETVQVLGAALPVFFHALEFAGEQETALHVQHISGELGRARASLERLEKSKSDFIAVAAHELKTPLTLIEGYATMMEEFFPEENTSTAQQNLYLKGIHSGTHRLREIVDDMIDVSMIDNNLLSITFQPMWVNRLLDSIYRDVADVARQRKLKLAIREFPGSGELTYGDGERLFQALKNLVSNAIKYTPDGGSITVDGRLLPGFIEVTVADTGIGIDPEDHLRIFEKFGRVGNVSLHSSGKTKFKGGGPGLGLPITKGIIESHGGAIWVESEGHDEAHCPGSTFHVLLPLRKAPPADKSERLFRSTVERQNTA